MKCNYSALFSFSLFDGKAPCTCVDRDPPASWAVPETQLSRATTASFLRTRGASGVSLELNRRSNPHVRRADGKLVFASRSSPSAAVSSP